MRPEAKKFLHDIQQAADRVSEFCAGKDYATYTSDPLLRSAVARITDYKQVISFRNILIHGYAQVDDSIVWDILKTKLPTLAREVRALLQDD